MPTYLSPGVYVEEKSSGLAPIVGAGTSTAGFIGKFNNQVPQKTLIEVRETVRREIEIGDGSNKKFTFTPTANSHIISDLPPSLTTVSVKVGEDPNPQAKLVLRNGCFFVKFTQAPKNGKEIKVSYSTVTLDTAQNNILKTISLQESKKDIQIGTGNGKETEFELNTSGSVTILTGVSPSIPTVTVETDGKKPASTQATITEESGKIAVTFESVPAAGKPTLSYQPIEITKTPPVVEEKGVKLCTNFGEFKKYFGGDFFIPDADDTKGQNTLAHAVYGFFRNGGTRCYVAWVKNDSHIDDVLEEFAAIDEIAIVAAPGYQDARTKIKDHCEKMGDRFAVLDSEEEVSSITSDSIKPGFTSKYAALYFPWIQVYDPASKKNIFVPPSGHIAGVYARVDSQRGVHKAPANETILGALDLKYKVSKAKQDGLNPDGINCIRRLNGNILVWGARTLGGDGNGEFKYLNVRRYFNYLKKSIDEGTQWTVFEPNTPELWAKIRRNISAFLTMEWRQGALFGTSPEQAFFVKCDAENNPPESRDIGRVVTEIGVAVIEPAEFVIFHLSQWTAE